MFLVVHYSIFSLVFAFQWQTECLVIFNYCVQNEKYLKLIFFFNFTIREVIDIMCTNPFDTDVP